MDLYAKGKNASVAYDREKKRLTIELLKEGIKTEVAATYFEEYIWEVEHLLATLKEEDFPYLYLGTKIEKFQELKIIKDDLREFHSLLNEYEKREKESYIWMRGDRITNPVRSANDDIVIILEEDEHEIWSHQVLIRKRIVEKELTEVVRSYAEEGRFEDYYAFNIRYNDFILVLFSLLPQYWDVLNQYDGTEQNTDQLKEWVFERMEASYPQIVQIYGWENIKENLNQIPAYYNKKWDYTKYSEEELREMYKNGGK